MGLPYGWCDCIIYTVIFISIINNVNSTNNDSSPNSQFTTTSFDSATTSQTGMLNALLTTSFIQASDTQFILSSSSSMTSPPLNNDTNSSLISVEITSSVNNSSQPEMSSTSDIAQSMPITPSPTVIGMSSESINASNSTDLDLSTASFRSNSSATYSSSQTSMLVTSSSVSSINDTDSEVLSPTSVLSSLSSLTGSSNIDSSSMYDGTTDSSVFTDISSLTTSPGQSSNQTTSMSSSQQSSPTDMFTSPMVDTVTEMMTTSITPSTQSPDLSTSSSSSSHPSSIWSMSETSAFVSQTTSMSSTIQPTSSFESSVSSAVVPTTTTEPTTTTTTTTIKQTTTTLNPVLNVTIDSSNVYSVPTDLKLSNCDFTKVSLRQHMMDKLKDVTGIRNVIIVDLTCNKKRRKRSTFNSGKAVANIKIDVGTDSVKAAKDVIKQLGDDGEVNIADVKEFETNVIEYMKDPCNTDICDSYFGYVCVNSTNETATCESRCNDKDCSKNGRCKIIVDDRNVFGTQCVCNSEDYYKYEGDDCETRRPKWELAAAIAGGIGGGIILILIFALILCCCCKSKDDKYKHRRDSYEPMSELVGKPAYYRNEGPKNHQTGFSNFGYEDDYIGEERTTNGTSWNPEESKDTYAKISEQLGKDNSFQIKRPQVAGTRPTTVNEDSTEGEDGVLTMSHRL